MEKPQYRKHHRAAAGSGGESPRFLRSKSGSTSARFSLHETHSFTSGYSITPRSEEIISAKKTRKKQGVSAGELDGGLVRFLPRSMTKIEVPRRTRSASTSPSAWALSPGRSLPCSSPAPVAVAPVPKSPASFGKLTKRDEKGVSGGGGVSGVLKYFRQKKASPVVEEEYNRFRVAYNRLLQWRFANARAESSMATVKKVAQKKLFNGWVRISLVRSLIAEKLSIIQKMKHELKLYQIMSSEMRLLNEWSKIEPKNVEAVGRVVRKLSAVSVCLPLVHNAEGDTMSVYNAISTAMEVMDNIRAMILDMHWQVEKTCYLLTELSVMLKQQKQFFEELEKRVTVVASLEAQEKSLRVHHIQLVNEVNAIGTLKDVIHLDTSQM